MITLPPKVAGNVKKIMRLLKDMNPDRRASMKPNKTRNTSLGSNRSRKLNMKKVSYLTINPKVQRYTMIPNDQINLQSDQMPT